MEKTEFMEIPGRWNIRYTYSAGRTVSRFLQELRDKAIIIATECPKCQRVLMPPRSFCERCYISIEDNWVQLEPRGTLESFTIVTEQFENAPKSPYVIGFIKLNGASTSFPHFLHGVDLADLTRARETLRIGMPIRIVFKERSERQGRMDDFWPEPV